MTQEEKQLLLNDLCGRLSYGVKVCARFNTGNRYMTNVTAISADRDYIQTRQNVLHSYTGSSVEDIRPYLRPMSSMTEEEQEEFLDLIIPIDSGKAVVEEDNIERYNEFIYAHHFDNKGLIEKGLALAAPEDMYKTE